jgi:putative colanic acid biosynthesis UDP-glucose lipid carrier transferase
MDIFLSALSILFVLSWLFPIIAFLIVMNSRGPVFFIQRRVGKAGKSFRCYKFRTMIVNPDADIKPACIDDPRVTKIGKILRKYNIDELPQFYNVLIGQMSIIGPRPHMYSDCAAFSRTIPGYKFRTFVKPGITGLAQANGYHGPATDAELLKKRFQLDAFYVRNASIKLDMRIMQATVSRPIKLLFAALRLF